MLLLLSPSVFESFVGFLLCWICLFVFIFFIFFSLFVLCLHSTFVKRIFVFNHPKQVKPRKKCNLTDPFFHCLHCFNAILAKNQNNIYIKVLFKAFCFSFQKVEIIIILAIMHSAVCIYFFNCLFACLTFLLFV